jgi:hypothetical protein
MNMVLYQHRFLGHTADGDNWMYSWWATSNRSLVDAQAAAVAWNAALWAGATAGNGLEDHVTAEVGNDSVTTVTIDVLTGLQSARLDTAQSIDGVAAGNALPADVALVVSLRTGLANRRGRGRFYLPQPAASQLTTNGRVLADFVTDLGASLEAAWTAYNTATDIPVVYSRTSRSTQPITTFDIGNLYDTQRGRESSQVESRTSTTMP